jgi:tRNA A-37 threonylcarbamoyl transferase component Bud32
MTDQLERLTAALAHRYAIEREVGRGGMATVYLARDLKHRRPVAVKVLHADLAAAIGQDRFLHEIEIVARLRHPHILPLHDSGDADGNLYFVMPYVAGESLRDRLTRERQLAVDEALHITSEVADALAYAHAQGIIHRDIKPANIMLESNHAVVTDFGIALAAQSARADRITASGLSPGTPEYMSPEQAGGEHEVDGRSDVYSLGCVLYEMLAGEPPFTGVSPQAVLMRKLAEPARSLRVVRASVPAAVEQVILKALSTTPADRHRTAAEFAEALEIATAEYPVQANPEPVLAPAPTPGRWLGVAAVSLAAVTALLTAIGFLTTLVYDVKLQMPSQFTPSRTDFPIMGVRALIPALGVAFFALVAYVVLEYAVRLLWLGLGRIPVLGRRLGTLGRETAERWRRAWGGVNPVSTAELFFIAALGISVAVLSRFWPLLASVVSTATEPLSLPFLPMHRTYTLALTVLTTILAFAWRRIFRDLDARRPGGARYRLAKWGGLAWIVILVLILTMPWRLLWDNDHPRGLLRGERVYILMERGPDLVLYNADRGVTERYQRGTGPDLQLLHTVGYVFESPEDFAGSRPGR